MAKYTKAEKIILKIFFGSNSSIAGMKLNLADLNQNDRKTLNDWGVIPSNNKKDKLVLRKDFTAKTKYNFAKKRMPLIHKIAKDIEKSSPNLFKGLNISSALVLETKTAIFLPLLKTLGANIRAYCNHEATKNAIFKGLKENGIKI
jgi:hypothetical protein